MRIKKSSAVAASVNTPKEVKNDYQECLKHIKAAIDVLGNMSNRDETVKDAIANLGVVYFDLK